MIAIAPGIYDRQQQQQQQQPQPPQQQHHQQQQQQHYQQQHRYIQPACLAMYYSLHSIIILLTTRFAVLVFR